MKKEIDLSGSAKDTKFELSMGLYYKPFKESKKKQMSRKEELEALFHLNVSTKDFTKKEVEFLLKEAILEIRKLRLRVEKMEQWKTKVLDVLSDLPDRD